MRRRLRTLRARLTVTLTIMALVVLVVAGGIVFLGVRRVLLGGLDQTLASIVQAEIASSADGPGGRPHLHEMAVGDVGGYQRFAEIEDEDGVVLVTAGSLGTLVTGPDLLARAVAGAVVFGDGRCGDDPCRAIAAPHPLRSSTGRRLAVIVALSKRPVERALRALGAIFAVTLVIAVSLAAWAAHGLSRGLIRPLERIASDARRIGKDDAETRIADVSPDAELRALVGILNDMLGRLDAGLATQRRFVADASHELRSPLANLRGTIEVALRRARSAPEYERTLAVALGEVERLSRLVDDLLTLSSADVDRLPMMRADVDLGALARAAVMAHRSRADERHVTLQVEAASDVGIHGDPDRMREVVDNLLDNALRHAPGSTEVTVRIASEGDDAVLSVADRGLGLGSEDPARVFERFYRADASRARHSGGLGLGLSIVQAIVAAHGGTVEAANREGGGSVFRVRLPRAAGPVAREAAIG